jgi:hypothetical protein
VDEGVRFDLSEAEAMIAHFQVKLDLFDKIKITQKKYDSLLRRKITLKHNLRF